MKVNWNDLQRPESSGSFPYRGGTITVGQEEIDVWRARPDALFTVRGFRPWTVMSTSLALPDRRTLPQSLTSLVGQERLALSTMGTAISRAARGYSPRQLLADAHIAASRRAHELCACKRRRHSSRHLAR